MSTLKVTHLQNENGTGPAMSLAVGGGVTFAGITTFHSNVDLGSNSLSGDLTGNVTGNVTGNLTGDVTVATGATVSGSTNTITASTNGEERLRVNSSGRVGIGTDTSGFATRLVVGTGDGETGNMTLFSGPSSSAYIHFADGTSGADRYRGYVTYSHSDNSLQFGTNDTEAARFNSSGNLAFPNGQGIDFSAVAGSGISANGGILDDYEEGTWTPTTSNFTHTVSSSVYTKIGRRVTVKGFITRNQVSAPSSGFFEVTGFPFPRSSTVNSIEGSFWLDNGGVTIDYVGGLSYFYSTTQMIFAITTNPAQQAAVRYLDATHFTNTRGIHFWATYITD